MTSHPLSEFEALFSPAILQRALNLYQSGAVEYSEEISPGCWEFSVLGSSYYLVSIYLNGKMINGWDCDCPYEGPICKHVGAVLMTLRNEEEEFFAKPSDPTLIPEGPSAPSLIQQISRKELENFLLQLMEGNDQIRLRFLANFSEETNAASKKYQKKLVEQIIKDYVRLGDRGYLDYNLTSDLGSALQDLLQDFNKLDKKTLAIAKEIIFQGTALLNDCDDSSGSVGDAIEMAFERLIELAADEGDPQLAVYVLDLAIKSFDKDQFQAFGFSDDWLSVASVAIRHEQEALTLLNILDTYAKTLATTEYPSYSLQQVSLQRYKLLAKWQHRFPMLPTPADIGGHPD